MVTNLDPSHLEIALTHVDLPAPSPPTNAIKAPPRSKRFRLFCRRTASIMPPTLRYNLVPRLESHECRAWADKAFSNLYLTRSRLSSPTPLSSELRQSSNSCRSIIGKYSLITSSTLFASHTD